MTSDEAGAAEFDALVLGGGQGGTQLAWHLARSGQRVAVVERRWIGGSCPNIACLPTKNEIFSARVAHLASHAAEFGVMSGPATIDMQLVRRRKREMVARDVAGFLRVYEEVGAELVMGNGRLLSSNTVEVRSDVGETRRLKANRIYLDLGSRANLPDIAGLAEARPLTHVEVLELDVVPSHLVVIGGGYVGIEMAQAFRRFGSRVTVLQAGSQILGNEDPDVATEMEKILTAEGIAILTGVKTSGVSGRSGEHVRLIVQTKSGEQTIEGSHILVAAGRTPNTRGISLEENGIDLDDRGYVRVNDRLETTVSGIWAIGECAGSPQFTHASNDDFRIIRDNLAGGQRSTTDRIIPYSLFTDPPLAHVGLTEREAQARGIAARVARLPISSVLRAVATGETQGFMKALVAVDGDQILGFTMIGSEAAEVVATVQTAMLAALPYTTLREAALAHPTMAEGLGPLFETLSLQARDHRPRT